MARRGDSHSHCQLYACFFHLAAAAAAAANLAVARAWVAVPLQAFGTRSSGPQPSKGLPVSKQRSSSSRAAGRSGQQALELTPHGATQRRGGLRHPRDQWTALELDAKFWLFTRKYRPHHHVVELD